MTHSKLAHLFLKDRVVPPSILGVKVTTPVGYYHCQRRDEEPNDEEVRVRVAAIQETGHGQEEQQSKEDVQVPKYTKHYSTCNDIKNDIKPITIPQP